MAEASQQSLLAKFLDPQAEATIHVLEASQLIRELWDLAPLSASAYLHLSKAYLAALLIQSLSDLEDKQRLSLEWRLDFCPMGHLYVDSLEHGKIRGSFTKGNIFSEDHIQSLGSGTFQVSKKNARIKSNSSGYIASSGDIATDLQNYLLQSEQKNCGIGISVLFDWNEKEKKPIVHKAFAYLIHILPESSADKKEYLLSKWHQQMTMIGPPSQWALQHENGIESLTEMAKLLAFSEEVKMLYHYPLEHKCNCDEDRVRNALLISEDAKESDDQEKELHITCQFCFKIYTYSQKLKKFIS